MAILLMSENSLNETLMKKIAALLVAVFALTACNTMEGFGQDMKKAGSKVEDTANKKK